MLVYCDASHILAAIMDSQYAESLTENERTIRERFAREYVVDFSGPDALIRCGYAAAYADEYSKRFLSEPYTKNLISQLENEAEELLPEEHRKRMIKALYRVINSPYSKGSEKVSAIAQLCKIQGLEAPVKTQTEVNLKSTGIDLSHIPVAELEQMKNRIYGKPAPTAVH